jgi:GntR family transcriptional regulator
MLLAVDPAAVDASALAPGDRLPTVRELAANLGLAPNTVARAYRELEAAGTVVGRGRRGTFVADRPQAGARGDAAAAAAAYVARARALGVGPDEAVDRVRAALGLSADATTG